MKRVAIISLFLLAGTELSVVAAQNVAIEQNELLRTRQTPLDSLELDMDDLPPLPYGLTPGFTLPNLPQMHRSPFELQETHRFARFEFDLPEFPNLSIPPQSPFEFVMPGRDLFISYNRYRRQEGITIPVGSVNSSRMIAKNGGYMPLVVRGDHVLGLTGVRQRSTSMGFSNSVAAGYSWAVTDGITLYGNLRASDNMYHLTRFKDISVSGRARVQVTDGVWLNGYGTYSIYNSAGTMPMSPWMAPRNSFGGTVEVRITDKFGIEGGAFREYDPFQRRWVTQPYVMPVFY